jgi:hypothetical protein
MAQLVSSLTAEINKIANKRTKTTLTKENIKEMIKELTSASTSISKTLTPGAPININLIVQGVQQIGRSKQQSLPRIAAEAGIIVGQEDKANVEIICERTAKIKGDTERVQKKQQEISDSIKKIQQMQKKVFEETNKIIISEQKYMDLEYTYAQSMLDVAKTLENESLDIRILQRKKQPDLAKIDLARKNLEKTKEQLLRLIRREGRRQWRGDRRAGPEKIKSHIRTLGNRVILSDVSGILDKIKISEESIMVFCQRDLPNMVSSTNPDWIRIRKTIQEIVEGGNRLRYVPSSFPSWSALLKQLESSINRFNK